jgi:hypothetical protein
LLSCAGHCCAGFWTNCQKRNQKGTQRGHDYQMDQKMAINGWLQTNQGLVPHSWSAKE